MVEEYAERATQINQKYLCVSDHGMMAAIPRQIRACEEHKLSPIFACELYYQPDHPGRDGFKAMDSKDKSNIRKSYHLLAIAKNEMGLRNLVKMSSWAWTEGFYYKPRVNRETLLAHKEGLIITSCCYNSEVGQAFDKGGAEAADEKIRWYKEHFGENYYLEIMLLDFEKQKPYDKYIVDAADRFGLPIILTNDCHYCLEEDSLYQRYMLMIAKNTTVADIEKKLQEDDKAEIFELQDQNLWMKSEEELNKKWFESYQDAIPYDVFTKAKENTVKVCQLARGVKIDRSIKLPQMPDADAKLLELAKQGMKQRGLIGEGKNRYANRLKEEYNLIVRKQFSSYFLIQKEIIDEARRISPLVMGYGDGSEAVGPGRGSAAGSLLCYVLGITNVDPIKHDLLFSRFLSENRGGKSIRTKFTKKPIRIGA